MIEREEIEAPWIPQINQIDDLKFFENFDHEENQ